MLYKTQLSMAIRNNTNSKSNRRDFVHNGTFSIVIAEE